MMDKWTERGIDLVMDFGPKVVGAILVWLIGSWIIARIVGLAKKAMEKKDYDASLRLFLGNLLNWALKIALFVVIISQLGVATTSLAAVIGAAGLAIGLALQGSLANFAGGVLILIFKPFKVGDLIQAQDQIGNVKIIDIFTTHIITPENRLAIIPNGILSNGTILNYTAEGKLRVDLSAGVAYSSDIQQAKAVLLEVLKSHPKILKEPAPNVTVSKMADSSVNFAVRPWCKPEDYWEVYFGVTEQMKLALDAAKIEIPFPHVVEIRKNV